MRGNPSRPVLLHVGLLSILIWIKIWFVAEQVKFTPKLTHPTKLRVHVINNSANFFNKALEGSGVIFSFSGGLGNQLFGYACSYALARDRNSPLYNFLREPSILSSSKWDSRRFLPLKRDYSLDKFQIPLNNFIDKKTTMIDKETLVKLNDAQMLFRNYSDKPFLPLAAGSYCVSEAYWGPYKDDILAMFLLRPEVVQEFPPYVTMIQKEIESSRESMTVHVRRGDYLRVLSFDIPISFQRSAIHRMTRILRERQNGLFPKVVSTPPTFFVFSDDIEFARENLEDLARVYSVKFVIVSSSPKTTDNRTTSLQNSLEQRNKSKSGRIAITSSFNPSFWKQWRNQRAKKLL